MNFNKYICMTQTPIRTQKLSLCPFPANLTTPPTSVLITALSPRD